MRIAVVKPDHLGDFILSVPALRALQNFYKDITIYVSSTTWPLAQFLFPEAEKRVIDFEHLSRKTAAEIIDISRLITELDSYDLVYFLRDDYVLRNLAGRLKVDFEMINGDDVVHETILQREALSRRLPDYSRSDLFGPIVGRPDGIRHVGLCIAGGFPTNRWPLAHWLSLARSLSEAGKTLRLIGGPGEKSELKLFSKLIPDLSHDILSGDLNFANFLGKISELDAVVATDSGTAHLCSLVKPMISIFTSSPWRRYAPFGKENIVVTRNLACSPCVQFSHDTLNGCMTRECGVSIDAEVIAKLLLSGRQKISYAGLVVQRGVSHA